MPPTPTSAAPATTAIVRPEAGNLRLDFRRWVGRTASAAVFCRGSVAPGVRSEACASGIDGCDIGEVFLIGW